jgi:hypothetical protein
MFNSVIIASVAIYSQGALDKNGKQPVILNVCAGKCPNRTILSGTIAENLGIEVGKTYVLGVRETAPDATYGRRFVYDVKMPITDAVQLMTIASTQKAEIFDVNAKEEVKDATASAEVEEYANAKA